MKGADRLIAQAGSEANLFYRLGRCHAARDRHLQEARLQRSAGDKKETADYVRLARMFNSLAVKERQFLRQMRAWRAQVAA